MNFASLLDQNIETAGEKLMLIFEEDEWTNKRLYEMSCRLTNSLKSLGIRKGDHVAVLLPNCPEMIIASQGIWRTGAVNIPIMSRLGVEEIGYILAHSDAKAIITSEELLEVLKKANRANKNIEHVIVLNSNGSGVGLDFHELISQSSPDDHLENMDEDDTALIIYTSGTTGKPKGVMLTHNNLKNEALSAWEAWEWDRGFRTLICLPLAHIFGITIIYAKLVSPFKDGFDVLMPWFDPEDFFRLVERFKINHFPGVPTMYHSLLNHPDVDRYETGSLERCYIGAAPVSPALYRRFTEKFKCQMSTCYALTETSPGVTFLRPSTPYREGSSGIPFPRVEIKIVDSRGSYLQNFKKGEIIVKGPNVMKGYYKMPEETQAMIHKGGWLHTGDVGYMDKDMHLYVTDRLKDMIIKGGTNVYPAEVEGYLKEHPSIQDVAVIGIPDEKYGENVMAYAVLESGKNLSERDLIAYAQKKIARFKCPVKVKFIKALPKTQTGKVRKLELREMIQ